MKFAHLVIYTTQISSDVYDAGEVDGEPYLVMEFVDGCDTDKLLTNCGPLSIANCCEIIRQACLGLQHAHEKGFVHRDLKPSNLMLNRHGVVKVMDLGLAKLTQSNDSHELTADGAVLGTPDYMPPEQWNSAKDVSIRSDIYSLGCTLFCLLTGAPPFADSSAKDLIAKMTAHLERRPPDLCRIRDDIPSALAKVVSKTLRKNSENRFENPQDFAEQLKPFCKGSDLAALFEKNSIESNRPGETDTDPIRMEQTVSRVHESNTRKDRTWLSRRALVFAGLAVLAMTATFFALAWPRPVQELSELKLTLFSHHKPNAQRIGVIGDEISEAYLKSSAKLEFECSGISEVYLISCVPSGEITVDTIQPDEGKSETVYPQKSLFEFTDGRGQYAFIAMYSRSDPGISPNEIANKIKESNRWLCSQESGVWRFDGEDVYAPTIENPRGVAEIKSENFGPFIEWLRSEFPEFEFRAIAIKVIAGM